MADTSAPAANGGKANAGAAHDSGANGPVGQPTRDQTMKTTGEFANLANTRKTPSHPTSPAQPLTHYHSLVTELLAWNNPRASVIAYVTIVSVIFVARYFDVMRWALKLTWMMLGSTIAAEAAGKLIMRTGFATHLRPYKYYMVPRETFDAMMEDVHELINFFVIEAQRILFVENVSASIAAFVAAFVSYYLAKVVPYWGLAVIGTTMAFLVPLIYTTNQELIDSQIKNASDIVHAQTAQARNIACKHTAQVADLTKQYMGDYSAKAQQMLRGRSASPEVGAKPAGRQVTEADFPAAPKGDIKREEEMGEEKGPLLEEEEPAPAPAGAM